jgi:hypothetical protein
VALRASSQSWSRARRINTNHWKEIGRAKSGFVSDDLSTRLIYSLMTLFVNLEFISGSGCFAFYSV